MWNAIVVTKAIHRLATFGTIPSFTRPRFVVETRMDHTAIVPRLMGSECWLGLNQQEGSPVLSFGECQRGGQAHNTATDDRSIVRLRHATNSLKESPRTQISVIRYQSIAEAYQHGQIYISFLYSFRLHPKRQARRLQRALRSACAWQLEGFVVHVPGHRRVFRHTHHSHFQAHAQRDK